MNLKQKNGITLIALVITIIVLLILAGITIATLTGQNGILTKANDAKNETESKSLKEEIELAVGSKYITDKVNGSGNLEEELKNIKDATVTKVEEGIYNVERNGHSYTVYDDGNIENGKLDIWDGETIEKPDVDEDKNWHIYTAEQMKFFAKYCNNELTEEEKVNISEITKTTIVYLENNIDMGARQKDGVLTTEEKTQWTPIKNFKGTFNGNGYYLSGIYVNNNSYAGIFHSASYIENLSIKNSYIQSSNQSVGGITGSILEEIKNCHNINTTVKSTLESSFVGGIAGNSLFGTIKECTNSGQVIGKAVVGGILGGSAFNDNVENCYNTGIISGESKIGGIVGGGNSGLILKNCYNEGKIIGTEEQIGGIIGSSVATMENLYNKCEIIGVSQVGGIAGLSSGDILNCYNKGKVTGTNDIGSIIGKNTATESITLSKLYYLSSLGLGAIGGKDIESQEVIGVNEDINSYEEFLNWIKTK